MRSKTGTTVRIKKKNFQDEESPHELFLTTSPKTKIRNAFAKNMLADIKLSKVQLSKMILAPLATMASASAIDSATQRKMGGKGFLRARKGITLVISSKDMDEIIRNIKSLENSTLLIDRVSETVKHEIKKTRKSISWYVIRNSQCFNIR